MNQNNKRLVEEKQLNRFFELVNSVDRGKDYPPVFNVLEATGKLHLEARMHTPIIAYLLDPSARHRQEKRFLKLFIEEVGLSDFSYKNSWVEKESRNIDILIRNDSQIIIIENKIYADDGENQLNNYYQEMKKDFDDDNIEVIYLTLNGHKPSEQSIKGIPKEKKIKNISYHKHIANWLDKCVKEMVYSPPVREGLIQYREAVKILLGEDEVSMERQELAKEMKEKLNGDFIDTTLMMSIVEINQKLTVLKFVETLQEKLSEEYKCTPQYVSREDFLKKDKHEDTDDLLKIQKNKTIVSLCFDWRGSKISTPDFWISIEIQTNSGDRKKIMDELDEVGEWTCNREGSGKNKIVSVYLDYRDEDWNEANIEEWTDVHKREIDEIYKVLEKHRGTS